MTKEFCSIDANNERNNMGKVNEKMLALGTVRSAIRDIFEYGNKRAQEIGKENVFDFSLGNPSVPAPDELNAYIRDMTENMNPVMLHGYTSAQGADDVRSAIAEDIKERFGFQADKDFIYMTCGAAASLTISLKALVNEGDEVIGIAPYFPEYKVFSEAAGARFVEVEADTERFQINFDALSAAVSEKTKAIILNSPNNPTGVVVDKVNIRKLCRLLSEKEAEYKHPIYLIADEPYRELVYDDAEVAYLPLIHTNTIVCYSFSKSLSVPGERIGYIMVSPFMDGAKDIFAAVCGAGRALGYVCAPSMMQRVAAKCLGKTSDVSIYKKNRDLLYGALSEYGFTCVHPDGAFYLFMKSPEPDAKAFCEKAKDYELLLVPSDSFGCEGYVRISYCVSTDMIERALPAFKKLAEDYKL